MTHVILRLLLLVMIVAVNQTQINAQSKIDTIALKKGEVFDILLLTQNADTEAELKHYFQTAIPIGQRMTYQSIPGFRIINHTKGNIRPSLLILAKWQNLEYREQFINQIENEIPDFHEQRRKIWSYFGLHYYEIQEDLECKIDRSKYHVATAYWLEDSSQPSEFYSDWKGQIKPSGGEVLLELEEGTSPFGYRYDPDFFIVTAWKSEDDFNTFQQNCQDLEMKDVVHVNEFILK